MVPATDVPTTTPAGPTPTPMTADEGIFYQPVQAYFQFVQNNGMILDESNIDHVRQEAEERHRQIMEQMVRQLRSDYQTRSVQMEQVCVNDLVQQRAEATMQHERDSAEPSTFMLSRTVAEQ